MANNNSSVPVVPTEAEAPAIGRTGRPLPATDDYIGKGRIAACCAKRRYGLEPDADEMAELCNHAAAVYWHRLEVDGKHPASAFVSALHATANFYFRRMRNAHRPEYLREARLFYLDDPFIPHDTRGRTYHDVIPSTMADSNPDGRSWREAIADHMADSQAETRLEWLSVEDLEEVLVRGRRAAGMAEHRIKPETVAQEATIIRLAAQDYTNEGIATLLGTTEGNIKHRRVQIRKWLHAYTKEMGVDGDVIPWDKSGGNPRRSASIQAAYRTSRKMIGLG